MNPSIILQGRSPDIVGTLDRSGIAGQRAGDMANRNALNGYVRQNGQAVLAGDQAALNGLAGQGLDGLNAAQTVQTNRLSMDSTRLGMDRTRQAMTHAENQEGRLSRQEERAIQQQAAQMSALERQAAVEETKQAVAMGLAIQTPEQWDQMMQQQAPELIGQFANREAIASRYLSIADVLERADKAQEPPKPLSSAGKLAEDLRRGVITPEQFNAESQKTGMRVTSDGKGGFVFEQGPGVTGNDPSDTSNPSSPAAMVATIDGILNDPALDTATGMLSWTQNIPGTEQRRFGARAKQLDGQAFLQAFESLKGGGQITEIEGAKATQAIGRLDTAQSADDYRQALTELRDVLTVAAGRPVGWAEQQSAAPAEIPSITTEQDYEALPSGTVFTAPDGTQRRKP